ncbi:MAG: response regulator [Pseudomonadota bacterium]
MSQSSQAKLPRVLAVDDDRVLLMMLEQTLRDQGYDVVTANNGKRACAALEAADNDIDVVLLDREMPGMSGIEVVHWIKERPDLRRLPIVMQTGSDAPEQIQEGIDAGVFYYLTKPIQEGLLASVLTSATRESQQQKVLSTEMGRHRESFLLVDACSCQFRTLDEAESLASFVANLFPEPDRVLSGLAALLTNAIEHGTLDVGYEEKTRLVKNGTWREEIERLQQDPTFAGKSASLRFRRDGETSTIEVEDQGRGFDWRSFMEVDPSRATDNHGRGIAQANMLSFDRLKYNERGNKVSASVTAEKPLEW